MRLGFLNTHPIQYCTPLFRELAKRPDVELKVYYCHDASHTEHSQAGFGVEFQWDISLFGGYDHTFLENVASKPSISGFWGLDVPAIGRQVDEDKLDALIVNGWHYKAAFQAMLAGWKRRLPILLRSDSQLGTSRATSILAAKRIAYPRFIKRAAGFLAAGTLAKEYLRHYGAAENRIFIVPHCVDDQRIRAEAETLFPMRPAIRAAWDIREEQLALVFAGKFLDVKRPMDFIQSIQQMAEKDRCIVGLMIGDGPLRRDCEAYVRQNAVPIRFTGFLNQSEMVRGYVAGDALLLASQSETWGLVVNEAMLCKLPCFVSAGVGCAPDLIQYGITGATFPVGDPTACAEQLLEFCTLERLRQMGRNARAVCERFSAEHVAGRLVDACKSVLNHDASRMCA